MWKSNTETSPSCPRCGSCNTKFCYYNNSLTQPRYFCKGCRRYWTKGGSLRYVPVGGSCRKNRRHTKTLTHSNNVTNHHALITSSSNSIGLGHERSHYDSTNNISSSASPVPSDLPTIDLSLIYENFLNQKRHQCSNAGVLLGPSSAIPLPEELVGVGGCSSLSEPSNVQSHFNTESDHQMYFDGVFNFNPMQEHQHQQYGITAQCSSSHETVDFELPPLPGEEAVSGDDIMMWSDSPEMMMVNHDLQAPRPPGLGPQPHDHVHGLDHHLLMDNWGPFDDSPADASFLN